MKDILLWAVPLAQLLLMAVVLPFLRSYIHLKRNHLRGIEESIDRLRDRNEERFTRLDEKLDRHLEWHATRGEG